MLVLSMTGLVDKRWTCIPRLWVRISARQELSTTEVRPLSKAPNPRLLPAPQCRLPTAPGAVSLGWVKCREHISLLVMLCIIVYVTNKSHLSFISTFLSLSFLVIYLVPFLLIVFVILIPVLSIFHYPFISFFMFFYYSFLFCELF